MYRQIENFRTTVAVDRNDTYKVDLPKAGLLSWLSIDYKATEATGGPFQDVATGKWRILDYLTNISVVVNGRTSIVNVPADLLEFNTYLDNGIVSFDKEREYSQAVHNARLFINFGGWMWDKGRALDLSDYDNVELQVKNECATTQWQDANKVTLKLGWMRDHSLPGNKEFWQYELWRTLTTVADKWEYLTLPTGKKIRRIVTQVIPARDSTTGVSKDYPRNVVDEIKLQYKNGQNVVWDANIEELWHYNWQELGYENFTHGHIYHFASRGFDVGIGEVRGAASFAHATGSTVATVIPSREGDQDATTQNLKSYSADHPTDFLFRGAGYQSCGVFDYDRDYSGQDLLDPAKTAMGDVLLDLHTYNSANSASGTVKVALSRLATPASLAA